MMKKIAFLIIIIAVIVLLIFLNFDFVRTLIFNAFYKISLPFLKFFYWINLKLTNFFSSFFSLRDLIQENAKLKQENRNLFSENISLKEVARENEVLRQVLNISLPKKSQLIIANVIGYNPQNLGEYILINKGSLDGLKEDLSVIDANKNLIGKIIEVHNRFSKVLLITDSNSRVNALVSDSADRPRGIVKGEHGLNLIMEMLPRQIKIEKGQTVITSGLNDNFPKGLIIGQIQEIIFSETDIFQKVTIKPAIDFNKLEEVFVIKQPDL